MAKVAPYAIYLKDYMPPDYLIKTVDLHISLHEAFTTVKATLNIVRNYASDLPTRPLILDGAQLLLKFLSMDGRTFTQDEYEVDDEHLVIPSVNDAFTLAIETEIKPQENTSLEGLYKSNGNYCTQCESHGFRKITYFIDRPDVMALFTTTIEADKTRYPVMLSNGNLIASDDLPNNRHFVTWADPFKKPSYLFALVAGRLVNIEDKFITQSGREVTLKIFVEAANQNKCDHAMRSLKHAMRWDEERFGREYDLDIFMIVAVHDFNMGAMENKGLNIFNTKYILATPETATDVDHQGIETVIGHEYFHNWTGNRITCRDWFQLSLKEGLTVFRDQEFTSDRYSRTVTRISDVRLLRSAQFPEDAGPLAHPVRPQSYIEMNNFYTTTVYNKGAEVIRMMQTLLTPVGFRRGMDLYFERHDGQAVTCDDFVKAMEDANDVDLRQFRLWYSQAGTPQLNIHTRYQGDAKTFSLTVEQHCPPTPGQPEKQAMHIPLAMGLLTFSGKELPLQLQGEEKASTATTRVLNIKQPKETFTFVNIEEPVIPSLLRHFSAPVKLNVNYSDSDLMFLLAHDTDEFNRWEAGQQFSSKIILKLADDYRKGNALSLPDEFIEAMRSMLHDKNLDNAVKAAILTLPTETYLGEQMAVIDVEAIYHARRFVRRELARQFKEWFLTFYQENARNAAYTVNAKAFAQRSLKNTCLTYLALLEDHAVRALCMTQFNQANNMTDSICALQALSHLDCDNRTAALAEFYTRWQDDPLVLDKWFMLQAMSELPNTLDHVKSLMQHPAFHLQNPNRVRALIGSFCSGNFIHFHDITGRGYQFLSEQVLVLDALNPQISARLLQPLTTWRRYDKARQALMKAELERLAKSKTLSKNVYEIVAKSLD